MLIRARYGTAEVPITYETDNDGEPVYSITITNCNTESVNDLGCLMVLLIPWWRLIIFTRSWSNRQTRMSTRADTFFIWRVALSGYSLDKVGSSTVRGRPMITCPWMIFMRSSMSGIVKLDFSYVQNGQKDKHYLT